MPKPPNKALRLLVPILVLGAGLGVAYAFFKNNQLAQQQAQQSQQGQKQAAPDAPAAPQADPQKQAAEQPAPQGPAAPQQAGGAPALSGLRAYQFPAPTPAITLGGLDAPMKARATTSTVGAGLADLSLADHFQAIARDKSLEKHLVVQAEHTVKSDAGSTALTPFAALAVRVGPSGGTMETVVLAGSTAVWSPVEGAPGVLEAFVVNGANERVLRIERRYEIVQNSHDLRIHQSLANLTGTPLSAQFIQLGPVDMAADAASYGGDKRRVRFGYLLNAKSDPTRAVVVADSTLMGRADALGSRVGGTFSEKVLWPSEASEEAGNEIVWAGLANRYFGVAIHPLIDPAIANVDKRLGWVSKIDRVVLDGGEGAEILALRLESRVLELGPAGAGKDTAPLPLGVYAGPLDRTEIHREPMLKSLGMGGFVVHNFGGLCAPCTFELFTRALLGLLHFLHNIVFHDWSLSIVFLVVIVRTLLHPVTRWSQIKMARFGKQMAAMGPKQKLLQEKFAGDAARLQQETAKLWKEEGISPAGFLGCLPAFLQTPVWIALYAVIYWSVEFRHQAGFYGLFQAIQPKSLPTWQFLADLGESDRFIYFGKVVTTLPMLGPIDAINILPIILGIVFFIQQKYLSPQTSAAAVTPEQEFQQKMMKWMMVVLWPLFMYNAPAALSIYFIANSTLAIVESKWIRAHMDKHGMLDLDKMKAERNARKSREATIVDRAKGPQGEGFFAKLQRMAEEKQKQAERAARQKGKR